MLYAGKKRGSKHGAGPIQDRIERCSMPEPNSGCWLWVGSVGHDGYGRMRVNGVTRQAHIVSYVEFKGKIPTGLELDHKCRVRCCVNPAHLEAVSHSVNVRRGDSPRVSRETKTNKTGKCRRGHVYDLFNTHFRKGGERVCRRCAADALALSRRRRRAITQAVAKLEDDDDGRE